jgi:hypothetical protein
MKDKSTNISTVVGTMYPRPFPFRESALGLNLQEKGSEERK